MSCSVVNPSAVAAKFSTDPSPIFSKQRVLAIRIAKILLVSFVFSSFVAASYFSFGAVVLLGATGAWQPLCALVGGFASGVGALTTPIIAEDRDMFRVTKNNSKDALTFLTIMGVIAVVSGVMFVFRHFQSKI